MEKRSPLNTGRSLARNRRKQARSAENNRYRAGLHSQKAVAGNSDKANEIQKQIDQISRRA